MASDNGDFDTDLAAAPAKRMRYSFADEIAQNSQFQTYGHRFTGFSSGDSYGKCLKSALILASSSRRLQRQTWRISRWAFRLRRADILMGALPTPPTHHHLTLPVLVAVDIDDVIGFTFLSTTGDFSTSKSTQNNIALPPTMWCHANIVLI